MQGPHYHEWEVVRSDYHQADSGQEICVVRVCFGCGETERKFYPIKALEKK